MHNVICKSLAYQNTSSEHTPSGNLMNSLKLGNASIMHEQNEHECIKGAMKSQKGTQAHANNILLT